ncbi:MAG: hypothetical protein ACK42I_02630 [Thermomicrobium sp.]
MIQPLFGLWTELTCPAEQSLSTRTWPWDSLMRDVALPLQTRGVNGRQEAPLSAAIWTYIFRTLE